MKIFSLFFNISFKFTISGYMQSLTYQPIVNISIIPKVSRNEIKLFQDNLIEFYFSFQNIRKNRCFVNVKLKVESLIKK